MIRLYYTIIVSCFFFLSLPGQRNVMGFPENFTKPSFAATAQDYSFYMNNILDKNNEKIWKLFADRTGVKYYQDPDINSTSLGELTYLTQLYYCTDEDENGWVKLGKPISGSGLSNGRRIDGDNFTNLGWVQKENLLLWLNGLSDPVTGIQTKAFLLNQLHDFNVDNLEEAFYYDSPISSSPIGKLPLYEFYYIYDIYFDDNGQEKRYLIGKEVSLRPDNISKVIMGWVNVNRVTKWNTRMALEPNFSTEGFNERKSNSSIHVKGFMEKREARKYSQGSLEPKDEYIQWDNDPVKPSMMSLLGQENPRRFKGTAHRFPCLSYIKQDGDKPFKLFKSGVIAGVSSVLGLGVTGMEDKLKNVNVMFVLEASKDLSGSKGAIDKCLTYLESKGLNLKTGVAIYRDIREESDSEIFDLKELGLNTADTRKFLESIQFTGILDNDDWTCLNYGFYKAIIRAGFKEGETNVLVHVGASGDYTNSVVRRRTAKDDSKYSVSKTTLRDQVSEYGLNIIHIQTNDQNGKASQGFQDDVSNLMIGLTKDIYVKENFKQLANCPLPNVPDMSSGSDFEVKDFITTYCHMRPLENGILSQSDITTYVKKHMDEILSRIEKKSNLISQLNSGEKVNTKFSSGDFTTTVLPILVKVARKHGFTTKEEIDEFLSKIQAQSKSSFYATTYFPASKYPGANYDPHSFVLLFPKQDLRDYVHGINQLLNSVNQEDRVTQREALKEYLIELAVQFTDEKITKKIESITLKQLAEYMQGIQGEGYDVWEDGGLNVPIQDITNFSKFPDSDFNRFIERLETKLEKLETILAESNTDSGYEYGYKDESRNYYFWIPLEDVF